jgi:hypothetical protein
METLNATKAELTLIKNYLNQAEARDKICRAIQYGSKFISAGEAGVAREVDKSTSLARKVFRLLKVGFILLLSISCFLFLPHMLLPRGTVSCNFGNYMVSFFSLSVGMYDTEWERWEPLQ